MRIRIRELMPLLSIAFGIGACSSSPSPSSPFSPWAGKTYVLDIPPANWSKPPSIGSDIGAYVPQFLIGVAAGSGSDLTITLGTANSGTQDSCNPTTQVTASGSNYPNVEIDASEFPVHIVSPHTGVIVNATIRDLKLTNVLPNGSSSEASAASNSGELSATVDISELYPLFYMITNPTKDSVCSTLASFGAACTTCPSTGLPYCLVLEAVQLGATPAASSVQAISSSDLSASCSASDAASAGEAAAPVERGDSAAEPGDSANEPADGASEPADAATRGDAAASDAGDAGHVEEKDAAIEASNDQ